jgi:hypothetical protein
VIDIVDAIESVVEAAAALHADRGRTDGLAATAVALAVPIGRQPRAAAALLDQIRKNPAGVAEACACTLGAVVVWRAVDRAERAGESRFAAAESGLRAALAYIDLVPPGQLAAFGMDDLGRRTALAILELQARAAFDSP